MLRASTVLFACLTALGCSRGEHDSKSAEPSGREAAEAPLAVVPAEPAAPIGPGPGHPVQRADDRKVIRLASGVVWERLTTESVPGVDFLYVTYEVGGASLGQRTVYDCGDYRSAFEQALALADYPALRAEQADARRRGRYLGIGFGCVLEKAGLGPWEYARVEVDGSGSVVVYSGVAAVGQGIETTLAQVVAEELAVAAEDVTVVHGDSARVPFGIGGFASRGAAADFGAAGGDGGHLDQARLLVGSAEQT